MFLRNEGYYHRLPCCLDKPLYKHRVIVERVCIVFWKRKKILENKKNIFD